MDCNGFIIPHIVDFFIENKVLDNADLKPETKELLKKIGDSSTTLAVVTLKDDEDPPTEADIKTEEINLGWKRTGDAFDDWEPAHVMKIKHDVSKTFSTVILGEDDLFGKYTFIEKLIGRALRNRILLPLEDSNLMVKDEEKLASVLNDLKLEPGKALSTSYNTDFNMQTDESFSRIFFYGMGSVLLVKQEKVSDSEFGPFVVDMPLQDLKVRELYRRYGARIHFSEDQKVTAIYDYQLENLIKPGEPGWDEAKMLAKVTTLTLITAREHLVWTHLIVSNSATRESTLTLPPNHPIRRLLTVFTFHANEVNIRAFDALVPNTSILHRAVGLKYSSMKEVFEMAYTSCDIYEPFSQRTYNPALQKLSDEGKFPYISQGSQYYEIIRGFVRNWLEKAGDAATDKQATSFYEGMKESSKGQKYELPQMISQDAMLNLLSSVIFTVTAYHEMIGHVIDYTNLPSKAGLRLTKDDPSEIDLQSFLNLFVITASTLSTMPKLMSKFENFFGAGGAPTWEIDVWKDFVDNLEVQSKKVQKEDKKRSVEFKYFDPAHFECSASV